MNSFQFEATYEDGVLKPVGPLPLREPMKVLVTVQIPEEPQTLTSEDAERMVRRSQGMLRWRGDVETLRRIADCSEV